MAGSPESIVHAGTPLVSGPAGRRRLDSTLAGFWGRWLVPSLSDLFFVALLTWLFVAGQGWQELLADGDAGWHIRTGEYILQHHEVPRQDLFSYSKPVASWFAWEWLSDVLFALAFRAAALKGVVLLAGVVIACFATLLLQFLVWRGANVFSALAVGLLSVGAASLHFLARPHVFTMLLLVISLWLVAADRQSPGARVWWLVPLTILWTNLHGGFLVLILCLGLLAAGCGIEGWLDRPGPRRWSAFRRYAILAAATAASSLVNPYGYRLHIHVIEYLRSDWIRNVVQEFQAPTFRAENLRQFEILLFAGLITVAFLFARKQISDGLWILAFAHMALTSVRHVAMYVIVSAPLIANEVTRWWAVAARNTTPRSTLRIFDDMARELRPAFRRTSVLPALMVAALMFAGKPLRWPQDFPSLSFPVNIVNRHQAEILQGRVFTEDQWGDYLLYRFYPHLRVFIDGRSDFYGP
ncbi:MAG: hypothetical protein ACRD9L_22755, partial [Bryobacteraceae bacterium]